MSGVLLVGSAAPAGARAENVPTFSTRNASLKSLVYVHASGCSDGSARAGSGFVIGASAGAIVTAHHVVGGCDDIVVRFETVPSGEARVHEARITRVLSSGDLALLSVKDPPNTTPLELASSPANKDDSFFGLGYQNGQPTGSDEPVKFSVGQSTLRDILPSAALDDLKAHTRIDVSRQILRFNALLQPGMSGGPIIDSDGKVIGVVAGGLKAGAAPASWGWPAAWISRLVESDEPTYQSVAISGTYYSLADLDATHAATSQRHNLRCGATEFRYHGERLFREISRGADDKPRLNYIVAISTVPQDVVDDFRYAVWVDDASGATAVVPAGYEFRERNHVCSESDSTGTFHEVVWAGPAPDVASVQTLSVQFEQTVMYPMAPYAFGYEIDPQLTTVNATGLPSPQYGDDGRVFSRKGFTQLKQPYVGPSTPAAHSFETLISKGGTFLGVGTINDALPANLGACLQTQWQTPGCEDVRQHVREWTRFVLGTQLSTFPAY